MARAKRILLICTLVATAWSLHTTVCEWSYQRSTRSSTAIVQYVHGPAPTPPRYRGRGGWSLVSGLFPQRAEIAREVAIIVGVITPLFLLAFSAYLVLGWCHQDRLLRGACSRCGYDLRAHVPAAMRRCPECGLAGASSVGSFR